MVDSVILSEAKDLDHLTPDDIVQLTSTRNCDG
jgi:hypothetical protein